MVKRAVSNPPVIAGHSYIRPLGAGGFADVFLFEQDMPRRLVAVKVLISDALDPRVLRAFNAEADIMARLSVHPSIITIHHAGISADGHPFFVMEYCPHTMSARYRDSPLAIAEVLDAGVRIASALETAHRAGLLHRDIKPSNLLITSFGTPVVADFGIATGLSGRTAHGEIFALSVPWSAPEVLQDQTGGSVLSEIWSLGATLYTLLAGRSPFELAAREKNTPEMLRSRIIRARYVPTGRHDVPERVESVIAKALSRDPARRQQSMRAFAEEIRSAQLELGVAQTPLEIAPLKITPPEWAADSAPIDFGDTTARGAVISTVDHRSRRSVRSVIPGTVRPEDSASLPVFSGKRVSTSVLMVSSIGIGALAIASAVVALLVQTRVL